MLSSGFGVTFLWSQWSCPDNRQKSHTMFTERTGAPLLASEAQMNPARNPANDSEIGIHAAPRPGHAG